MQAQVQEALRNLSTAIKDVEAVVEGDSAALLSWQSACDLGFRGTLGEWERLMGATSKR